MAPPLTLYPVILFSSMALRSTGCCVLTWWPITSYVSVSLCFLGQCRPPAEPVGERIQWVRKVFRPLYMVHSLFHCSHLLKSKMFILFLIIVHSAPRLDRKNKKCRNFCKFIKKEKLKCHKWSDPFRLHCLWLPVGYPHTWLGCTDLIIRLI